MVYFFSHCCRLSPISSCCQAIGICEAVVMQSPDGHQAVLTFKFLSCTQKLCSYRPFHRLQMPREEIAFTAQPKIYSHSRIFRDIQPKHFSSATLAQIFFDLCPHWVSVDDRPCCTHFLDKIGKLWLWCTEIPMS